MPETDEELERTLAALRREHRMIGDAIDALVAEKKRRVLDKMRARFIIVAGDVLASAIIAEPKNWHRVHVGPMHETSHVFAACQASACARAEQDDECQTLYRFTTAAYPEGNTLERTLCERCFERDGTLQALVDAYLKQCPDASTARYLLDPAQLHCLPAAD